MDTTFIEQHQSSLQNLYTSIALLNTQLSSTFRYLSNEHVDYDSRSSTLKWMLWLFIIYFLVMVTIFVLFSILEFKAEDFNRKMLGFKTGVAICGFLFTFTACLVSIILVGYAGLGTGICRYSYDSFSSKDRLTQIVGESSANLIGSCMYSQNPNLYSSLAKIDFDRVDQIVPLTSRFHTKVSDFSSVEDYSEGDLEKVIETPDPSPSSSGKDLTYANSLLTECGTKNEI